MFEYKVSLIELTCCFTCGNSLWLPDHTAKFHTLIPIGGNRIIFLVIAAFIDCLTNSDIVAVGNVFIRASGGSLNRRDLPVDLGVLSSNRVPARGNSCRTCLIENIVSNDITLIGYSYCIDRQLGISAKGIIPITLLTSGIGEMRVGTNKTVTCIAGVVICCLCTCCSHSLGIANVRRRGTFGFDAQNDFSTGVKS